MATFTVTAVDTKVRDWQSEHGTMRAYKIKLKDAAGTEQVAEWSRKLSSPAPEAGQTVEGEIVQGQYGARFKKTQSAGGLGPRPEDPKRAARILRQHSQDMAMRVISIAYTTAQLEAMEPRDLFDLIKKTADWFDKDAEEAAA